MALNYKQNQFVFEYLIDFNATQAATRAGYSPRSAGAIGFELLKNTEILEAIADAAEGRLERLKVDADYVLQRLLEVDRMDVADILEEDGTVKPIREWPEVWRQNISAMDLSEIIDGGDVVGVLKKIKWPDKTRNRELLGKHMDVQAFREKLEIEQKTVTLDKAEYAATRKRMLDSDDC